MPETPTMATPLPKQPTLIEVNTEAYLSISKPQRIKNRLSIALSDHSYLPRIGDLASDWVAHVAVPAFKLFRAGRGGAPIESFCSIGTGSGLDVLSAIEILGSRRVGLTDVHRDVVAVAAQNISRNHLDSHSVLIESGHGDLLKPLQKFSTKYDLIYENLPNVPLSDETEVTSDRNSSLFLGPRRERVPDLVRQQLLDLHYLALVEARDYLKPGGAVLSTIGGRIPLKFVLQLGELAGFSPSFQSYTWKIQGDPNEIIKEHLRKQQDGFGPFYFYRTEILRRTFGLVDARSSGANALEIEKSLLSERLNAAEAFKALQNGESIGHTVAVLKSELKPS